LCKGKHNKKLCAERNALTAQIIVSSKERVMKKEFPATAESYNVEKHNSNISTLTSLSFMISEINLDDNNQKKKQCSSPSNLPTAPVG
jgi:hypothetical protein